MPLSQAQKSIAETDKRFRVAICGRRFGKTFLSVREMAKFARHSHKKVWYIAPSYRQAKQVVWDQLKQRLGRLNWIERTNESDLTIHLVNGSQISLRSADNPDSMRGVGLDFVVFDEFADMSDRTWQEIIRPTLSDRGGHALFIGTPKGLGNWAYDIYNKYHEDPDNWASFQFTTLDGGNVPQEEIESAQRDLDERTFRQEYLAKFETYSGIIYYAFGDYNIISDMPKITESEVLHVGMDFNIDPATAVIGIRRGEQAFVLDEIEIHGSNTDEMVMELRNRYPKNPIIVYPDASGQRQTTSSGGRSDHIILKNAGFVVKANPINPAVKDRIASVNAMMKNTMGDHRLLINKKCRRLIECLRKQTYKEGTRVPDKDSGLDHFPDALGYWISYVWPIRTITPTQDQPKVFAHF